MPWSVGFLPSWPPPRPSSTASSPPSSPARCSSTSPHPRTSSVTAAQGGTHSTPSRSATRRRTHHLRTHARDVRRDGGPGDGRQRWWSPGTPAPRTGHHRRSSSPRSAPPAHAARACCRSAPAPSPSPTRGSLMVPGHDALGQRPGTGRAVPARHRDERALYVDAGQVLTSAGVAAGLDLCLHVVRRDHGASVAAEVARRTVIAPHRAGGQAQYLARPVSVAPAQTVATTLERTRAWALEHSMHRWRWCTSPRTRTSRRAPSRGASPRRWHHPGALDRRAARRARARAPRDDRPLASTRIAWRVGFRERRHAQSAAARDRRHHAVGLPPRVRQTVGRVAESASADRERVA